MIELKNVSKTFTLHNQGSAVIEVISDVSFAVAPGECVALTGASGAGKSTLMRMIYGNYLTQAGEIRIGDVDIVRAEPRDIIKLRRDVLGYVSQFLRVVPRVPALDVVAEPLLAVGCEREVAYARAQDLMEESGAYKFLTHEATPVIYRDRITPALRPDGLPLYRYFGMA